MHDFPHHYTVTASARGDDPVSLRADNLPEIVTAPPAEFDGPGDRWSPESLLVAAAADCFVLGFRAIARASKLDWTELHCNATGVLDRVDRSMRFTTIKISATLHVPEGTDPAKADRLLHKAEETCLITNSLNADIELTTAVEGAG